MFSYAVKKITIRLSWALLALLSILALANCKRKEETTPVDAEGAAALKRAETFRKQMEQVERLKAKTGPSSASANDLAVAMWKAGITNRNYNIPDQVYVLATEAWLDSFKMKVQSQFSSLGVKNWYSLKTFDCDDFANGASFLAQVDVRVSTDMKASVACGVVYYHDEMMDGHHAINFVVLDSKDVVFFEPQTSVKKTMSKAELSSVTFWRL